MKNLWRFFLWLLIVLAVVIVADGLISENFLRASIVFGLLLCALFFGRPFVTTRNKTLPEADSRDAASMGRAGRRPHWRNNIRKPPYVAGLLMSTGLIIYSLITEDISLAGDTFLTTGLFLMIACLIGVFGSRD